MSANQATDPPLDSGERFSQQPTGFRWVIFALACGTSWFLYLHRYTWNFIGPELRQEYGYTQAQIGFLGGLFNWTYGGGQIPSGLLSDAIGPHLMLGLMIMVWSLLLPGFGLAKGFWGIGAVRLAFGAAAQAGAYPSLARVTHSWFPLSRPHGNPRMGGDILRPQWRRDVVDHHGNRLDRFLRVELALGIGGDGRCRSDLCNRVS